jgi:hypothetical protein
MGTPETIPTKVRNEISMSAFSTSIQYNFGVPSQSNQKRARNKKDSNRE